MSDPEQAQSEANGIEDKEPDENHEQQTEGDEEKAEEEAMDSKESTDAAAADDNAKPDDVSEVMDFTSEQQLENNEEAGEEPIAADQADAQDDEKEVDMTKEDEDEEEEEEDEGEDIHTSSDPNVMPQVNVTVLAQRRWQVKVYPLKPADFVSGQISRVFKNARESLLYLLSPGRNARGKGEMYISAASQAVRAVFSLMKLTYFYPEINVEIIKKNDEGSVEEKAYIRFDSKMTNLLTLGSFRVGGPGRKRERLIGSVFVKNLPPGTTKDVLRVMFPFAQEINYNPEKFKDCSTARLVLKSRNHVIPCLKAFAKIELGGNVLELHPLEKKKRTRPNDDDDVSEPKYRKKDDNKKEVSSKKKDEESSNKSEIKSPEGKKDSGKAEVKKEVKGDAKEKNVSKANESNKDKKNVKAQKTPAKTPMRRGPTGRYAKDRSDQDKGPYRPKLVGGQERSSRGTGIRRGSGRDWTSDRGDRPIRGRQDRGMGRGFRATDRNKPNRSPGQGSNRSFGRSPRGFGVARSNQSRMNYSAGGSQGLGAVANANLAVNADATKEMVILQSQLSMAIKSQLAMLNQTQLAVEQAKRGASSLGLGADVAQSSQAPAKALSGGSAGSGYGKRSSDQYRRNEDGALGQQYGGRTNRARERGMRAARGGGQGSGYGNRRSSYREQIDDSYYDRASDLESESYGRSSRDYAYDQDYGSSGYGSRSGYGQDSSYY